MKSLLVIKVVHNIIHFVDDGKNINMYVSWCIKSQYVVWWHEGCLIVLKVYDDTDSSNPAIKRPGNVLCCVIHISEMDAI